MREVFKNAFFVMCAISAVSGWIVIESALWLLRQLG